MRRNAPCHLGDLRKPASKPWSQLAGTPAVKLRGGGAYLALLVVQEPSWAGFASLPI